MKVKKSYIADKEVNKDLKILTGEKSNIKQESTIIK